MSIYEKLSLIQNELKAPKNQYNKFGKYNYRNCEDILEAVKPICNKHKTTLIVKDTIEQVGDRYYIKAICELHDWESDDVINAHAYARESQSRTGMDDSQLTGATSSYARKYALNGLFNIDDTKDADTNEFVEKSKQEPKSNNKRSDTPRNNKNVSVSQLQEKQTYIHSFYTEHKNTFTPVLKGFLQGRKLSELPEQELDGIIEVINTSRETFKEVA